MEVRTLDWGAVHSAIETRISGKTAAAKFVKEENINFWADFYEQHKDKLALMMDTLTFDIREKNSLTREEELILRKAYSGMLMVMSMCHAEKVHDGAVKNAEKLYKETLKTKRKIKI